MKVFARVAPIFWTALFLISPAARAADIDESPLPIHAEQTFIYLEFRRPIVLTHAGDGTDRVFVAEQEGVIRVFPNNPDA